MDKITSMRLKESTKKRLETFGNYGESHEEILIGLMEKGKDYKCRSRLPERPLKGNSMRGE